MGVLIILQLFYRSISIVSELTGASEAIARLALLKAIYGENEPNKVSSQLHGVKLIGRETIQQY